MLALVCTLASCKDNELTVTVNDDGYIVVNGVTTEILADKDDVITVDGDGYVVVNGTKTEHKIHTTDEISVNADGYVVVNGVVTEIVADKDDVITVDGDGFVVVNGTKTEHKIHTTDEILVNADGYVVVNGVTTEIIADKEDEITIDSNGYIVVNGIRTDYKASVDNDRVPLDSTKLLIIESVKNESERFVQVLDPIFQSDVVHIEDTTRLPNTAESMIEYGMVVLFNVANNDMPDGLDEVLQSYVYDFKGGMLTVCGQELDDSGKWTAHAYTRTDMYGTIYQDMLPVQIINYTPPTAVMILIDTSGSMVSDYNYSQFNRLSSALSGAEACIDALTERDYVGIMGFAETSEYYLDITPRVEREKILCAIDEIEQDAIDGILGGSTLFAEALTDAGEALTSCDKVEKRHIILVTDGEPVDSIETYGAAMKKNSELGITMSIVCIDPYFDTTKSDLARALIEYANMPSTNLYVSDVHNTPTIMREDLCHPSIKEVNYEPFTPSVATYTSVLENINVSDIPPLNGFYGSKLKEDATAVLNGEFVPIYAQWNYGLGTVGSFMCDLNGTWSDEFLSSDCGQKIINNIVRSIACNRFETGENNSSYTDEKP